MSPLPRPLTPPTVRNLASVPHLARIVAVSACVALNVVCISQRAAAGERFRAVRLETGLTVVPFAVPVATPAAVVGPSQAYYGYAPQPTAASDASADNVTDPQLLAEFEAFRRWRASQRTAGSGGAAHPAASADSALPSTPLLTTHCSRCHSGPQAKGEFQLDGPLTSEQRLAAIRAALAGEMPKGKPLPPDELGPLLYELSQP